MGFEPTRKRLPRCYAVVGPERHGVVAHALRIGAADPRLGGALLRVSMDTSGVRPDGLVPAVPRGSAVMLHVTDRLLGGTPEEAARVVLDLSRRARLALVLHDIPQPAEGDSWYRRRRDAYAAMTEAADSVVVASHHERHCLERCRSEAIGSALPLSRVVVVPLPVESGERGEPGEPGEPGSSGERDVDEHDVAVLGYLYPGKGVEDVIAAAAWLRRSGRPVRVTCLGAVAEGHAEHASALLAAAGDAGVPFQITGFVPDHELRARLRAVAVPVAPHRHISASGTINAWLEAGRRPVTCPSAYARELVDRLPGTLSLAGDLRAGILEALEHPARTSLPPHTLLGPSVREAASEYADVLDQLAARAGPTAAPHPVIA